MIPVDCPNKACPNNAGAPVRGIARCQLTCALRCQPPPVPIPGTIHERSTRPCSFDVPRAPRRSMNDSGIWMKPLAFYPSEGNIPPGKENYPDVTPLSVVLPRPAAPLCRGLQRYRSLVPPSAFQISVTMILSNIQCKSIKGDT